jgi:hypothetical protein
MFADLCHVQALVGRIMPNIGFIECVATTELVTCVITTQPSITLASVQSVLGTMSGLLTYNIMVPSGPFFHADVLGAAIRATAGCLRGVSETSRVGPCSLLEYIGYRFRDTE